MVKRRNSILVFFVTIVWGMIGCQSEDRATDSATDEEPEVVTFAYPEYLTHFAEANYQDLADTFNKENPDIQVELRVITVDEIMEVEFDFESLMTSDGENIDVLMRRGFRGFVESDAILPLDNFPDLDLEDFFPLALKMLRYQGVLRGIPAELDVVVLYYNKDLFDQAGVAYPHTNWTRDDFLHTAVALKKALPERAFAFGGQVDEVLPFIYTHGGQIIDENGEYTLTDPMTIEAVKWYSNLALAHNVMPLPSEIEAYWPLDDSNIVVGGVTIGDEEEPEYELRWSSMGSMIGMAAQEGEVAIWPSNFSRRQGFGGWDWDFEWGIVPWPQDQQKVVVGVPYAYFIPANSDNPEGALRWIDFISMQPPELKGLPARRSIAEELRDMFGEEIGADVYDSYIRLLETGKPIDYQMYNRTERYLGQAMLDILENGEDVEAALSNAQDFLNTER